VLLQNGTYFLARKRFLEFKRTEALAIKTLRAEKKRMLLEKL